MVWLPRTTFAGRSCELIGPVSLFIGEEMGSSADPRWYSFLFIYSNILS